jgi:hypothetical protein
VIEEVKRLRDEIAGPHNAIAAELLAGRARAEEYLQAVKRIDVRVTEALSRASSAESRAQSLMQSARKLVVVSLVFITLGVINLVYVISR